MPASASAPLQGKKVAILVTDGFEQVELTGPRKALQDAGAKTEVVAPRAGKVKAWKTKEWGEQFDVDRDLHAVDAESYDALLLPGGVMNPDTLRTIPEAVRFVKAFFAAGKPVAAICHGPQLLISAKVLDGRDLPRTLDADRRGRGRRPTHDVVAFAADRSAQCRRRVGRRRGRRRPGPGDEPQARRSAGLQRQDARRVRRRTTRTILIASERSP
jgi:protease I